MRGRSPATDMRYLLGPAAAAAGITDVDCPVVDMTQDNSYNNLAAFFMIGTVADAASRVAVEVYKCDDIAGTNPVLVTGSDDFLPVAGKPFQFDLVGVPANFIKLRLKRKNTNVSTTGAAMFLHEANKLPTPTLHAVVPWN